MYFRFSIEYIEEFEQCWAELKDHVAEATVAAAANAGEEVEGGEPVKKRTNAEAGEKRCLTRPAAAGGASIERPNRACTLV